jgi:hypothetical protein
VCNFAAFELSVALAAGRHLSGLAETGLDSLLQNLYWLGDAKSRTKAE